MHQVIVYFSFIQAIVILAYCVFEVFVFQFYSMIIMVQGLAVYMSEQVLHTGFQ
jgi:hypothetical protein